MRLLAPLLLLAAGACIQGKGPLASDASDASDTGDSDVKVEIVDCHGCVIADTCRDEGEVNPQNLCEQCVAARDPDDWSPVTDARSCEDDDPCTNTGSCADGACVAPLRPECENAPDCVDDVVCGDQSCAYVVTPGKCLIEGVCRSGGDKPPDDPCRVCKPDVDPQAWSFTTDACDDGDACTYEDVCTAQGKCQGQRNTCSDELSCTLDFCDGGQCLHQVATNSCLVDDQCFAEGTGRDDDQCAVCDPSRSTTTLTVDVGASCEDHNVCTASSSCRGDGACSGTPIARDDEPNNVLSDAQDLGIASKFPVSSVNANLVDDDNDFFRWGMTFTNSGAFARPKAAVAFETPTVVLLCVYARCGQTSQTFFAPTVQCKEGQVAATLDDVTRGCCQTFPADEVPALELATSCLAGLVQGFAYTEVRAMGPLDGATCGGYVLEWGTVQ